VSGTSPLVGPCLVPIRAHADHGLDGEAHARLRLSNGLVLRIVRNVGRAVEKPANTMSAVGPDDAAFLALRVLLDDVSVFTEKCAWLDNFDGLLQAFPRRLGHAHRIWVCQRLVADVEGLVQVGVEPFMVDGDIDVQDIAVFECSLVGNAVADDFVQGRAYRLRELAVVEG
jgi:hypothetical protein